MTIKIFCLAAALVLLAGCATPRPDKVRAGEEKKVVEPNVVNQTSSGPNSPNIVKQGSKVTVTYEPGGPVGGDKLVQTIILPAGQQFVGFISKTQAKELGYGDGSQNLFVTKDARGIIPQLNTVWKSGHTPNSWEAVLYIQEH